MDPDGPGATRTPAQQAGDAAETLVLTGWSRPAGRSWPGTSMSAATRSTSWRSTRVRRAALVIVEVRWRRSRGFGLAGGDRRPPQADAGRQAAYGLLDRGTARRQRRCRTAPRFDLVVVEPGDREGSRVATTGRRSEPSRRAASPDIATGDA